MSGPRLNKAVAQLFGYGRRVADSYIQNRDVIVNGQICADLAYRVQDGDTLIWRGQQRTWHGESEQVHRYIRWYKPRGVECTFGDSRSGYRTLQRWQEDVPGIRYGGRLDVDSEGLMLLSTDGAWLNRWTHPSSGSNKIYHVWTSSIPELKESKLTHVDTEIGPLALGQWDMLNARGTEWRVCLQQGANRQVRRIVGAFGGTVERLVRESIGPFDIKGIGPGQWLNLELKELSFV